MRRNSFSSALPLLLIQVLLLSACGTSTKVTRTYYDDDFKGRKFSNVLVIAVADNYDARAQFERSVVAGIKNSGADATAYYTVIGRNPPVTVNDVTNAVRARKFDAVLFTRVKGSTQSVKVKEGPASAKSTVIGGNVFDLFRYDYEEYQEPENVTISTEVVLLTELYAAAEQKNIWTIELSSFDKESVELIVDSAAAAIVKKLNQDRLLGSR